MTNNAALITSSLLFGLSACLIQSEPTPEPPPGEEPPPAVKTEPPANGAVHILDVSLLYGLPTDAALVAQMVRASDIGIGGELVPSEMIAKGRLEGLEPWIMPKAELVVVGVRVDPCAARRAPGPDVPCQPEVRLVLQPVGPKTVAPDQRIEVAAYDSAVHAHYAITEAQVRELTARLMVARTSALGAYAPNAALGVHPGLLTPSTPFAIAVRSALLATIGKGNLERVTFMTHSMDFDEDTWTFSGFESLSAPAFTVPTTTVQAVHSFGSSVDTQGEVGAVEFFPKVVDGLEPLVGRSVVAVPTPAEHAAFAKAVALINPQPHNAENIDCVSCHYAEAAKARGEQTFGLTASDVFTSPRSLAYQRENLALNNVHAFSYVDRAPSVMQRTAFESAVAADQLQALLYPGN